MLRRRQLRQHRHHFVRKQVDEHRERQLRLAAGRARLEHLQALLASVRDPRSPEHGLADPGLTLEDERSGAGRGSVYVVLYRRQFGFPLEEITPAAGSTDVHAAESKSVDPRRHTAEGAGRCAHQQHRGTREAREAQDPERDSDVVIASGRGREQHDGRGDGARSADPGDDETIHPPVDDLAVGAGEAFRPGRSRRPARSWPAIVSTCSGSVRRDGRLRIASRLTISSGVPNASRCSSATT